MSNTPEWSSRSQGKVASTLFKFPKRKWSHGMRCYNLCSRTNALFGNDAFIQFEKLAKCGKWHCHLQWSGVTYIMYMKHGCKKVTNGKKMRCSLLICHMQIFKSIEFTIIGILKWCTFFDTHCSSVWLYTRSDLCGVIITALRLGIAL